MSHRLLFVLNTHERVMSHRLLFVSNTLALATYERRDNSVISPLLLVCVTERGRERVSQRASVYKRGRMSCIVLQCVAVCCSELQCVRERVCENEDQRKSERARICATEKGDKRKRERERKATVRMVNSCQ